MHNHATLGEDEGRGDSTGRAAAAIAELGALVAIEEEFPAEAADTASTSEAGDESLAQGGDQGGGTTAGHSSGHPAAAHQPAQPGPAPAHHPPPAAARGPAAARHPAPQPVKGRAGKPHAHGGGQAHSHPGAAQPHHHHGAEPPHHHPAGDLPHHHHAGEAPHHHPAGDGPHHHHAGEAPHHHPAGEGAHHHHGPEAHHHDGGEQGHHHHGAEHHHHEGGEAEHHHHGAEHHHHEGAGSPHHHHGAEHHHHEGAEGGHHHHGAAHHHHEGAGSPHHHHGAEHHHHEGAEGVHHHHGAAHHHHEGAGAPHHHHGTERHHHEGGGAAHHHHGAHHHHHEGARLKHHHHGPHKHHHPGGHLKHHHKQHHGRRPKGFVNVFHRVRHHRHRRWFAISAGLILLLALLGTTGYALNRKGKNAAAGCRSKAVCIFPDAGPQETEVTLTYPAAASIPQGQFLVAFQDDADNGEQYPSQALPEGKTTTGRGVFKAVVPWEPCLNPYKGKKRPIQLRVYAAGSDGQPLAGIRPGIFKLKCREPNFAATTTVQPASLPADGLGAATVMVNTSIAYTTADGQQHSQPTTGVNIAFTTTLGTLSATSAVTDSSGIATTSVSSKDAGVATVTPTATSAVPAPRALQPGTAHFVPRIDAISENFDENASTTFISVDTTPDASRLTFAWSINYPGSPCGAILNSNNNNSGYAHPGCDPVTYEPFVTVTVTATDAGGDKASCTFAARGYEGQGVVHPAPCG